MVTKQINATILTKGIGIGLASSIMCTIIGTAVSAWFLSTEKIGEGGIRYITAVLLLLSSSLGALVSWKIVKQRRLPVCLIAGSIYFLALLAINALFFNGAYSGVGESALVVFAGALSVAILGLTGSKKAKTR